MSFLRHGEIYRSDGFLKTVRNWARRAASRWSAPGPAIRTRRKERALLIVRDEFPVGYSSIGLLSSRARLRFTNWRSFCYE
jgi:hypothetical protein